MSKSIILLGLASMLSFGSFASVVVGNDAPTEQADKGKKCKKKKKKCCKKKSSCDKKEETPEKEEK
ncbi:hypothetical protein OAH12_00270 [Cyclobacteriaceae bacterium]|nr:hypothetical protein [Cyclobacteriaceae bacterium]